MVGRQTETEKNISGGRGCASLRRGVPRRDGGQTGDGENNQVWHVQHPEQTNQGVWNLHFSGRHRNRCIVEFYRRRISQKEFTRGNLADLGDGDGGAERSSRQRRNFIPQGRKICYKRDPPPRHKRHQILASDGAAAVACCGMTPQP